MEAVESEVQRLIGLAKCKQAVELAKEHHKKAGTAESQTLLVQAYVARIQQFQGKGMGEEAQTLITLVRERFPAERHLLSALEIRASADAGKIDDLLRPLASDQTPPALRAQIESTLANNVTDLSAVAGCGSLPQDHPIRVGAAAVWKAFTAVTCGPVTYEQISLPEISRRSPFAAWKLLIRSIACFYRNDDTGCRRSLDAIPPGSAVANVASAVRALVDDKKPSSGLAFALYSRVMIDDEPLRAALRKTQNAFGYHDLGRLLEGIRESIRLCGSFHPELVQRLRQHISVLCVLEELPVNEVVSALGVTIKNAYFWRLHATAREMVEPELLAVLSWERFYRHGVDEKLFAPDSAEAAAVWLHIGEIIAANSPAALDRLRHHAGKQGSISALYTDQPVEIARLRPLSDQALADQVLVPGAGFEQATRLRPDADTFKKWFGWAQHYKLPVKQQEDIASRWHESLPRDIQPLLVLASLAEERKALSMAVKRIAEAERIDPMNQLVRRARVRLTLAITWRHFAEKKAHLVEKDITELETLGGMKEGDRAMALEAIRGAWHQMRGEESAENACFTRVADRIGYHAATFLFDSIKQMTKQSSRSDLVFLKADAQPLEIAIALATVLRMADDVRLDIHLPKAWRPLIKKVLGQRPCPLAFNDLLLIGRGAIAGNEPETAYLASSAGLARSSPPAVTAKFLMLRASSVNQFTHRARATQCLRAALQLARQANDQDLIRDIFAVVDRDPSLQRSIAQSRDGKGLADGLLEEILDNEKRAETYPTPRRGEDPFVVKNAAFESPRFDSFGGGFFDAEDDEDDFDDDYDRDDEDDNGSLFDYEDELDAIPDTAMDKAKEVLVKSGVSSPEQLLKNPMLMIETLSKMLGKKVGILEMKTIADGLMKLIELGHGGSGGGGKNRKKNRRR